jgi:hypothetical protein
MEASVSSSRRISTAAAFVAALTAAFVRCGPGPKDCLRYSDCDPGLTCAYGRCVYPPAPDSGEAGSAAVSSADAADVDATGGDETTGDEATDDASTDDASAPSSDDASSD